LAGHGAGGVVAQGVVARVENGEQRIVKTVINNDCSFFHILLANYQR
jgi:hypothetical protein